MWTLRASGGRLENSVGPSKIMKYALCVKLCQHNLTIVIVHKLLVHGHCMEYSLPSRSSRCLRLN